MRILLVLHCFVLVASCSPTNVADASSVDVRPAQDVDTSVDVESTRDASMSDVQSSADVEVNADVVASTPDVTPADVPVLTDLGPVQCRVTEDCGDPQLECNRAAPGGICLGCGVNCPEGTECGFGACIRECEDESDCHVGFRCLGSGRCALDSCTTDDDCEGPYVCGGGGNCERPLCDEGACPAPLSCVQERCVED